MAKIIINTLEFNYNNFLNRKRVSMLKLEEAITKGEVDEQILPHLNLINSLPFCFTTSSCSGRIALIDAPLLGPKRESCKAFRWHDTVSYEVVLEAISSYKPKNVLWLKFDSFIIAFSVASAEWATFFIKLARYLNFKDSGIRSINPRAGFINMDFTSTEKMSFPVRIGDRVLVDEDYLREAIEIANFMMKKNLLKLNLLKETLERLHEWLKDNDTPPPLGIFDQIISKYRAALVELKRTRHYLRIMRQHF